MKRYLLFAVLALATVIGVRAQEVEFTADRPGASTGPATVAAGVLQWEQGVQYDFYDGLGEFTFSNTLFRLGISDHFELRLGGDALVHYSGDKWIPAFSGINLGTKINCFEGKGAIPEIAVMANLAFSQLGSEGYVPEHLTPSLHLLFENSLTDKLSLGYNLGVEWDGINPAATTFIAVGLSYELTDGLGCFAESYNYFSKFDNAYMADFGFSYMVARRFQLDLAANIDVCRPSQMWAVSFGFAWQLNK